MVLVVVDKAFVVAVLTAVVVVEVGFTDVVVRVTALGGRRAEILVRAGLQKKTFKAYSWPW